VFTEAELSPVFPFPSRAHTQASRRDDRRDDYRDERVDDRRDARADDRRDARADERRDARADERRDARADERRDARADERRDARIWADDRREFRRDERRDDRRDERRGPSRLTTEEQAGHDVDDSLLGAAVAPTRPSAFTADLYGLDSFSLESKGTAP
jgi:hypothetical protein